MVSIRSVGGNDSMQNIPRDLTGQDTWTQRREWNQDFRKELKKIYVLFGVIINGVNKTH